MMMWSNILGLLPLLPWALLVLLLMMMNADRPRPRSFRHCMLIAATLWAAWAVLACEVLSLGRALSFWPLLIWWAAPAILIGVALYNRRRELAGALRPFTPAVDTGDPAPKRAPAWHTSLPLAISAVLAVLAGMVAILAPPNTIDVIRYHLPRQVYWMQQSGIQHFAGDPFDMTILPPGAEFLGLHFMVLTGADAYANVVQWFALLLIAIAASLTAREIGLRAAGQAIAALLVVTNPAAWIQSSSAKNDLMAALWVILLAYWTIRVLKDHRFGLRFAPLIGLAAGLAMLTKPTAVIFALPLAIILGGWLLLRHRSRALPIALVVAVLAFSLNAGHWARNWTMYGHPLPGYLLSYGRPWTTETHHPAAALSNIVKNVALHLGSPWPEVNDTVHASVLAVHRTIGWDIADERSSVGPIGMRYGQREEETAAAPVHLTLIVFLLALLPFLIWRIRNRPSSPDPSAPPEDQTPVHLQGMLVIIAAVLIGAYLFSTFLKWQPSNARLHVGLFTLAAPASAVLIARMRGPGIIAACTILLIPLIPVILWNDTRPLLGERSILTASDQKLLDRRPRDGYHDVIDFVNAARAARVALQIRHRYPMQRPLLHDARRSGRPLLLMHLQEHPEFRPKNPWPDPDLIIIDMTPRPEWGIHYGAAGIEDWAELHWWRQTALNQLARNEGRPLPYPDRPDCWQDMPHRPLPSPDTPLAVIRAQIDMWRDEAMIALPVESLTGLSMRRIKSIGAFRILATPDLAQRLYERGLIAEPPAAAPSRRRSPIEPRKNSLIRRVYHVASIDPELRSSRHDTGRAPRQPASIPRFPAVR